VENYVGIICSKTSPYEIVSRAIDDASFMCTRKYGDAPDVIFSGRLDLTFPYVPTHLREFHPGLQLFWSNVLLFESHLSFCVVSARLHHVGAPEK
jgi:hypothetical protein